MSNLIQRIEPTLVLTGNIDTIFDEIARPKVSYDITVRLSVESMTKLLTFASQAISQAAKADNQTVLQLIAEFTQVVGCDIHQSNPRRQAEVLGGAE